MKIAMLILFLLPFTNSAYADDYGMCVHLCEINAMGNCSGYYDADKEAACQERSATTYRRCVNTCDARRTQDQDEQYRDQYGYPRY